MRSRGLVASHAVLATGAVAMVGPFAWQFLTSLKTLPHSVRVPPTVVPDGQWSNYAKVFRLLPFGEQFLNTVAMTAARTLGQLLFCSLAGYAFARLRFPGRRVLFGLFLSVLMVPPQLFVIPQYQIIARLGWLNSLAALIVPGLFSAFGTFLLRQFFLGLAAAPAAHAATIPALGQHIAVPAYVPPSDTASWNQLSTSDSRLGFVVANVANGPDTSLNTAWQGVVNATHNNGTKVLGYVDTGYFGFTSPARQTVLGDTDATAWLVQAEQDINRWYQFYGTSIDGIFLDDVENVCGPASGSTTYVDLYRQLDQYVHTHHPGALTVANPGVGVPDCYADAADVLVTFEGSYTDYLNPTGDYVTQQWQLDADPNKFWHLVYDVPDQAALTAVMNKSKQNNAGYVYATPDVLANPWDTVPSASYWSAELAASQVTDTTTPAVPQQPYAISTHATTVHLGWTSNSSSREVGYDVYQGGTKIGSVGNFTPSDTDFEVAGLQPSTQYTFSLRGRDLAGTVSAAGTGLTVTTAATSGHPPTAPGSLTASALAATGVRLSWTASTDSYDYVAYYDVYQNGTRVLTVDPSITSVHVGFLTPGQQYSFAVVARDSTGTSSAASGTVTVTPPLPAAAITSPAVDLTSASATFTAQFNLPFSFYNVFIDTDGSTSTGYQVAGVGADFLIQNGTFYQHSGTGFTWAAVSGVSPLLSSTGGLYRWQVPTSSLGTGVSAIQVVFNGSGSSPDAYSAIIAATLH